jgi:hypothetical protein
MDDQRKPDTTREPHPDFDGHLEFSLRDKTPDEKIAWLEAMIELRIQLRALARDADPTRSRRPEEL